MQNKIDILEKEKKKAECQIDSLRMHVTKTDEQKLQLEKEVQSYKNQVFIYFLIYPVQCVSISERVSILEQQNREYEKNILQQTKYSEQMEETINRQRKEINNEAEQTKKTANELDTLRIKYTSHKERADQDKKEFLRLREQFVQLRDSLVNKDRTNKDLQKRVEQLESDLFQKSQQVKHFQILTTID